MLSSSLPSLHTKLTMFSIKMIYFSISRYSHSLSLRFITSICPFQNDVGKKIVSAFALIYLSLLMTTRLNSIYKCISTGVLSLKQAYFLYHFFSSRWNSKWTDCWRPSKAAQTYFPTTSRNQIKNHWFQQTDLNFSSRKVFLKRAIFLLHSKTICLKTITKIKHFTD